MDITGFIPAIVEIGLIPALLILFVWFFFEKDKRREKQLDDLHTQFDKREGLLLEESTRREEQYKERERILVAESARREEILKKKSEKREKIIRDEAEKRETALMATIDSFSKTMEKISENMSEIKNSTTKVQYKIDNIENALQLGKGGVQSG